MDCFCDHAPNEHAALQDFGTSMCLVTDCECDGTREQVAAMAVERMKPSPTVQKLLATILEVMSNPMPRTTEDQARNVAAAIVAEFEIWERL